jgi:hypothetical protein
MPHQYSFAHNLLYSTAEFMADEVKKYEMGKRWLAKMMGADIETFTDSDVEVKGFELCDAVGILLVSAVSIT